MEQGTTIIVICVALLSTFAGASFAADYPCSDNDPSNEIIPYPHPQNCSLYYECFNGSPILNACPDGLYYNPKVQSCDFPDNTDCTPGYYNCPDNSTSYWPWPEDCSYYVECYMGDSYLMSCPPGLWWSDNLKDCVDPKDSVCGSTPTIPTTPPTSTTTTTVTPSPTPTQRPTDPPTTTTTERPTTPTEPPTTTTRKPTTAKPTPTYTTPNPMCMGVRPGQIVVQPYPDDCTKYYKCTGADLTIENCPPGFMFDEQHQTCNFPDLVDCPFGWTTPYPITTTTNSNGGGKCSDGATDYWPIAGVCNQYEECYHGGSYIMNCPSGLLWSTDSKSCVDPAQSDCGKTTPTPRTTTTRHPDWTPNPQCPDSDEDEEFLFPYPGDCTQYISCWRGDSHVMKCPPGLWFNPTIKDCDYPYQAGCEWGKKVFRKLVLN